MRTTGKAFIAAAVVLFGSAGSAQAALLVSGSVGGAPTGVNLDSLDWLSLGNAGGLSPESGLTINFSGNAQAVSGSSSGVYAAPYVSGGNAAAFGNPQADGPNITTYVTAGSTGAVAGSAVEILLPGSQLYFGLLWGSVDNYNTLSFYDGAALIGSITGADVVASPNGDQGVNGTLYVNITSTQGFDRVVATSSQFAFEFDNISFNQTVPVSEPGMLALLGLGLLGMGMARVRRRA